MILLRQATCRAVLMTEPIVEKWVLPAPLGLFFRTVSMMAGVSFVAIEPVAMAQDSRFSLEARSYLSLGVQDGDFNQAELVLEPKWERDFSRTVSATLSARLRIDVADDLDPGRPDTTGYSDLNGLLEIGDEAALEIRDAYLDIDAGPVFLRFGKQQIVWGELEGFRLLDVINPQAFREFILDDFDDARIGIWAASAELPISRGKLGDWDAQLVWAPDPTVSEIPVAGAEFEFLAPRFLFGAEPGILPPGGVRTEAPDDLIDDASYGARLVGLAKGWDLSLVAFSGIDPEPVGRTQLSMQGLEVVRVYQRRKVLGGSAAKTFGPVTARFETAIQPERTFTVAGPGGTLGLAEATQIGVAMVADFQAPFDVFASLQLLYDRVINPPAGFVRPRDDVLTSVYARREFQNGNVIASMRWLGSDGGGDGVISPEIEYAIDDSTSISMGADIFYGASNETFGQFGKQDRVTLSIRKVF